MSLRAMRCPARGASLAPPVAAFFPGADLDERWTAAPLAIAAGRGRGGSSELGVGSSTPKDFFENKPRLPQPKKSMVDFGPGKMTHAYHDIRVQMETSMHHKTLYHVYRFCF
jgi:hypothetical protein